MAELHQQLLNGDAHGESTVAALKAHGHSHGRSSTNDNSDSKTARWKLLVAMGFCIVFMIAEVIGGYFAGSLAIMTDAAHLLSDVAAFSISLFAVWLAERPPTVNQTFGFHRIEIFGAVISVFLIWILTGVLLYEAVNRFIHPEEVDGKIMFITAICGVAVNLAMMRVLHQSGHGHSHGGGHGHSHGSSHSHAHGSGEATKEQNINVRAAFIHTVGDFIQSIGVMIAAAIIWAHPDAKVADPICTILFSVLVLFTTFGIMKSAYTTLLNSVPGGISLPKIAEELLSIEGVANIHDLHIWAFGTNRIAMTVHLVADNGPRALEEAQQVAKRHNIGHSTIQVEKCGTTDVDNCYEFNEHIGSCAITVESKGDSASILPTHATNKVVIDRPPPDARHSGPNSCGELLSPGGRAPSSSSARTHGHSHEHSHSHGGGEDHGHSHDGGHGHSHEHAHSHSHGEEDDHGHSHDGDHGHSH